MREILFYFFSAGGRKSCKNMKIEGKNDKRSSLSIHLFFERYVTALCPCFRGQLTSHKTSMYNPSLSSLSRSFSLMETLLAGFSPTVFSSEVKRSHRRATVSVPHWRKPKPSRVVCMAVSNSTPLVLQFLLYPFVLDFWFWSEDKI